jgi:hypothetical protein
MLAINALCGAQFIQLSHSGNFLQIAESFYVKDVCPF